MLRSHSGVATNSIFDSKFTETSALVFQVRITLSQKGRFSYFQQHYWLLTVKYMCLCVWLPSLGNCVFWETKTLRRKEIIVFFNSVLALGYPRTVSNPVITLFSKTIIMCKVLIYLCFLFFLQKKAKSLVAYYSTLIPDDKAVFLKTLASQYSVDHSVVLHLAKSLETAHVRETANIFWNPTCKFWSTAFWRSENSHRILANSTRSGNFVRTII